MLLDYLTISSQYGVWKSILIQIYILKKQKNMETSPPHSCFYALKTIQLYQIYGKNVDTFGELETFGIIT